MIACSHPGKMGDALYALPTVKKLCELNGCNADFYTSSYCEPLRKLVEYQSYIDGFYIPPNYVIERSDIGIQPWRMPIDLSLYSKVYHLGFRQAPNRSIPDYIAFSAGLAGIDGISYEYPTGNVTTDEPYYVVAPRGNTTFKNLFLSFIEQSKYKVFVIGGAGDYIGKGIDITGLDMLYTLEYIAKSKGFLGLMSSQLVLANGFDIPKIAVHDGKSWDMGHVIYSNTNFYPVNPTVKQIENIFGGNG